MKRPLPILIVPSLVMALALTAAAQDARPKAKPTVTNPNEIAAVQPLEAPADVSVIDVEFPGGTFGEFIEYVQTVAKPRPNIVVSPEISETKVAKLSLKRLTLHSAMKAAITASDDPNSVNWQIQSDQADGQVSVYRVTPDRRQGVFPRQPKNETLSRALQVFPYRDWIGKPETVLSAIENAVQMLGEKDPPIISFHKESGLIFVSGTKAHSDLVKEVLGALEQRANATKSYIDHNIANDVINTIKAPSEKQALELLLAWKGKAEDYDRAMADNSIRNATNQEKIDIIRREVEEVRKRADERTIAFDRELLLSKTSIYNSMTELNALRAENQRLKAELETLRATTDKAAAAPAQPK